MRREPPSTQDLPLLEIIRRRVELAPVAEQLPIFAELHSPEPTLTRSIVLGDCQMEDRVRTCGKATEYFCQAH